jgi:5-methylcytosine-specific restriction endonuclease McrA
MVSKKVAPQDRRKGRWTDEDLRLAVKSSSTWTEMVRHLGLTATTNRAIRRRIEELGLDVSRFPKKGRSKIIYTEEALREIVPECYSMAAVARAFGARPVGSVCAHIRRKVTELGISTVHFRTTTAGRPGNNRMTPEQVFMILPDGSCRRPGEDLRRMMTQVGIEYKCAECGNPGQWNGKPLTLDVDHVNGEWLDNRLGNLRFLCPNCHSQTDTWRGRNHGRNRTIKAPLA